MLNPNRIDVEDLTINENVVEDPIEILVDLATKGEIDPWNVDIVAVTDKFLKRLEGARRLDLRNSGRTLFYAAVLLRMKADALSVWEESAEPDITEPDFIVPFEQVVIPRLRRTSSRRVTLQELINSLREAESIAMKKGERLRKEIKIIPEDILRIPHEEDSEVMIKRVAAALDVKFTSEDVVPFSELLVYIGGGTEAEKSTAIMTFLSLLFIATREKNILLEQEKLFGELYIRKKETKKTKLAEACAPL